MIRHLRNEEIDRQQWDRLLDQCPDRLWYARSRVLDRMAPGWEALIDDQLGILMPLTWRRKWGIHYLYNPYGAQQLGVFNANRDPDRTTAFLAAVPGRFRYIDIWLNAAMARPEDPKGAWLPQVNQTMIASDDMDSIRGRYAKGHLRNLRKSGMSTEFQEGIDATTFMDLFERTTGARHGGLPAGASAALRSTMADALDEGTGGITGSIKDGKLVAAVCTITWGGRSILLKSANTPEGQSVNAMFHLYDHWIASHAGTKTSLDFAGSNTPGVARFNAGFGAVESTYFRFRWNRLPWPMNHFRT